MFDVKTGKRIEDSENLMKASLAGGTANKENGKDKESSKLTYKERLIQELNMNLEGYYYTLVPGDANLEAQVYMGNAVKDTDIVTGDAVLHSIFSGYLLSEAMLSLENREVKQTGARKTTDLRFFKTILGEELHNQIVKELHALEDKSQTNVQKVLAVHKASVDRAVTNYMNTKALQLERVLTDYGIVSNTLTEIKDSEGQLQEVTDSYTIQSVDLGEKNMSRDYLFTKLKLLSANYAIANIELHKLLFSDPYQYSDELKRIKNFLSPRQPLVSRSSGMNSLFNRVWNRGYKKGDVGRTDMLRDHANTVTLTNVNGILEEMAEYTVYDKTDGSGIVQFRGYRNIRIRSGDWSLDNEEQYRYDIAWYKQHKKLELSKEEVELLEKGNPGVMSTYTPLKPIVAGNKMDGKSYNDVVMDKFALYPLSYRVIYEINPTANALKLYDKMIEQDIDYVVFESGRKVGANKTHDLYKKGGEYNNDNFAEETISKIPFSIMSIQAEVPSKDTNKVTKGSQVTKLVTMDMMDAGVPVDYMVDKEWSEKYKAWIALDEKGKLAASELYREIKRNEELLKKMIQNGYQRLLGRLGIVENQDGTYSINDIKKAGNLLREEMTKREVNINMSKALQGFLNGDVLLEATPAYQQIRNILYSIADKEIVSQSMNGGLKVQIPVVLLESENVTHKVVKDSKGNEIDTYTSNELKFYNTLDEKGNKRTVCEIMLAPWFNIPKDPAKQKELLNYLNNTAEGQKILQGIAYRIPTQKQNSIDAFVIKKFLPKEFGDSVVVPEAIVKKSGSDFDIDKLSIYLKSVYFHGPLPKVVPFFGYGEQAKEKFGQLFEQILADKTEAVDISLQKREEMLGLMELLTAPTLSNKKQKLLDQQSEFIDRFIAKYGNATPDEIIEDLRETIQVLGNRLYTLTDNELQDAKKEIFIEKMYKQSIENEYIDSLSKLVTSPYNIPNMVKPNSADQLKKLSKDVVDALGFGTFDYQDVGNMMDRHFMSRLRHAFITGKYAIGIAAVNQTNHSLNQRSVIYIDPAKIEDQDPQVRKWLDDGIINLPHNTVEIDGKTYATLSKITSKDGKHMISDILSQFIDGYVDISKGPWIIEMGATPNVASTFMFLVKVGVPVNTVVYFMNQPIIRDYLRSIENAGYSWLFIADFVKEVISNPKYAVSNLPEGADYKKEMPSTTSLKELMGKKEFTIDEKLQQQYILKEFLKYAGMAGQLFNVTQGSNFDTTSFNDPYLIFKKINQLKKAQNSIISSVDDILDNSFLGELRGNIESMRDAVAELLPSDKGKVRNVVERVLEPYTEMPDREFLKIARKVVNDVFDWAVQTNPNAREGFTTALNTEIQSILTGDNSAAKQLYDFFETVKKDKKHPLHDNVVVRGMELRPSGYMNGVDNLKFTNRDNKIYDQNQIIAGFQELKQYFSADDNNLYNMLVTLAVLQSGLTVSPISFTSLLPYEDFKNIYNKTLASLEGQDIEAFYNLRVFERNNWNNPDIVPQMRARPVIDSRATAASGFPVYQPNPSMAWVPKKLLDGMKAGVIPIVLSVGNGRESKSEFITYTWYARTTVNADGKTVALTPKMKAEMASRGDFSYIRKGLFRRVMHEGKPFSYSKKGGREYYLYKLTDAWGDGIRANEFYKDLVPSVLDNRLVSNGDRATNKPSESSEHDAFIVQLTAASFTKKDKYQSQGSLPDVVRSVYMSDENAYKLLKGQKTSTIRSNREAENIGIPVGKTEVRYVNGTPYNFTNKGLLTIEEAGGKEKMVLSEGLPTVKEGGNVHPIAVKGKTYYSMFKQTQNWMNGSGKMFVYDIQPVDGVVEPKVEEVKPEEVGKSTKVLKSMDAKALYKAINTLDNPTDAEGLALQYLAGGGKISVSSLYSEVLSTRDSRLVTQKVIKEESKARDYVDKYGPSVKDTAHKIWEDLLENIKTRVNEQDIRNALIDVVATYNKRFDAATAYFEKYGPQEDQIKPEDLPPIDNNNENSCN